MLISATSALVLNWTSKEIWTTGNAKEYFAGLDLSEGDRLLAQFDEQSRFMQTQSVTNRKYFVRKHSLEFLNKHQNLNGQAIILAAGIAPLSVELASIHPKNAVFDVDKYSMTEKEKYLKNICPNIRFIECDITNIELLNEELIRQGWNPNQPAVLVMEGITYYLREDDLRNIFKFFSGHHCWFIADFMLKPEYTQEKNRIFGVEVFRKIQESIGLEFLNFYAPDYFMQMVKDCGFDLAERFTMDTIQQERAGKNYPFEYENSGWINLVSN
jgi:O-methyltransferase involved in polyketide biosynthesis